MSRMIRLQYYASRSIVEFYRRNPLPSDTWTDDETQRRARLNVRIQPPAMGVFFRLLTTNRGLFTFEEYSRFAVLERMRSSDGSTKTVMARLKRNFFPSAIDSLHVFAMLVETGEFEAAWLDVLEDVTGATDISVQKGDGSVVPIALSIKTRWSIECARKKARSSCRASQRPGTVNVYLTLNRGRIGNKRWYQAEDLEKAGLIVNGGLLAGLNGELDRVSKEMEPWRHRPVGPVQLSLFGPDGHGGRSDALG